jgi:hypothetical protein
MLHIDLVSTTKLKTFQKTKKPIRLQVGTYYYYLPINHSKELQT